MTGQAQLAHQEHIHVCAQRLRHLVRDWYSTTRQSQHQYVWATRVGRELGS
jgi:hypothetical protein